MSAAGSASPLYSFLSSSPSCPDFNSLLLAKPYRKRLHTRTSHFSRMPVCFSPCLSPLPRPVHHLRAQERWGRTSSQRRLLLRCTLLLPHAHDISILYATPISPLICTSLSRLYTRLLTLLFKSLFNLSPLYSFFSLSACCDHTSRQKCTIYTPG